MHITLPERSAMPSPPEFRPLQGALRAASGHKTAVDTSALIRQLVLTMDDEIKVDLFAGGGGASEGIEQATGMHVDVCINHDRDALAMHMANHPQAGHMRCDVREADPRRVCAGRPVGLLWASPDCRHFSNAKGGAPVSRRVRSLSTVVVRWVRDVRPRCVVVENVSEMRSWGPLVDGRPCEARKGQRFEWWLGALRSLGYRVEWREIRACDFGAPTIRKRLFIIARRDGQPIVWPEPTHAEPSIARSRGLRPWRTMSECIDWSVPTLSVFARRRPLADATMRRVAHGLARYVLTSAKPFVVLLTHQGAVRVYPHDEPLRTITAANRGEFALGMPYLVQLGYGERKTQNPRSLELQRPLGTVVAGGGKHGVMMAFVAKHFGGSPGDGKTAASLHRPAPTVLARGAPQSLVTARLVGLQAPSGASTGHDPACGLVPDAAASPEPWGLEQPCDRSTSVAELLTRWHEPKWGMDLHDMLGVDADDQPCAIARVGDQVYRVVDVGLRMLLPHELFLAQGFRSDYIINIGADGRRLSKSAQIRMCGNSVSPPVARALVEANYASERRLEHHLAAKAA